MLVGLLMAGPAMAEEAANVSFLIDECDRAAAHPADPDRVAPGLEKKQINLPAAEAICRKAHEAAPDHARTAYTLGRTIYYQDRRAEALPYLEMAAARGYRQAVFVLGYVLTLGGGIEPDFCRAQSLWRQAAALDHPWSNFHLIEKQLDGKFAACKSQLTKAEMAAMSRFMQDNITIGASYGRVEALVKRLEQ